MKKTLFASILLLIISGLNTHIYSAPQKTSRIDKTMTIYSDVMRQLDMNYVDTLNYESLLETSINQMLRQVDPYTIYYPKKRDDDIKILTTGKYGGIGALIQQREQENKKGEKETYTYISNPYEGKPAQRNGVQAGDRIISVDNISVEGKQLSEVSNALRGVPGTIVRLELEREGTSKPIILEFEREEIHMDAVDYYCTVPIGDTTSTTGYIYLGEFIAGSSSEFSRALDDLVYNHGVTSLIIDLRGNGGGIVDEAVDIVGLFVDKGTEVVKTKGKTEVSCRTYATHSNPHFKDMPVTILVDNHSASASEIVSGSLQDLGRAKLIGQRTFGKGLVQNLRPIAYGGHLKVTTSKYYLPSGRCIQAIDYAERQKGKTLKKDTAGGILPDIVMDDSAKVDITYSLYAKHLIFDYATRYHRLHDSIALPQTFMLTDEEIEDFCKFLDERKFEYETETSKYFHEVIKMAQNEDIDSVTLAELKTFESKLKPSYRSAIERNKAEVKRLLGADIVERYYYQKGKIAFMLRFDEELQRAIQESTNNMQTK